MRSAPILTTLSKYYSRGDSRGYPVNNEHWRIFRGGKSRGFEVVEALDHDMVSKENLIPGGILEFGSGQSFLFFGKSKIL